MDRTGTALDFPDCKNVGPTGLPLCEEWCDHTAEVAYIDDGGYVYCEPCGKERQWHRRCRKMRPHELNRTRKGLPLLRY